MLCWGDGGIHDAGLITKCSDVATSHHGPSFLVTTPLFFLGCVWVSPRPLLSSLARSAPTPVTFPMCAMGEAQRHAFPTVFLCTWASCPHLPWILPPPTSRSRLPWLQLEVQLLGLGWIAHPFSALHGSVLRHWRSRPRLRWEPTESRFHLQREPRPYPRPPVTPVSSLLLPTPCSLCFGLLNVAQGHWLLAVSQGSAKARESVA